MGFWIAHRNGNIGGMIRVEDESKIVVTLDSVWAWDHRPPPVQATYAQFRESWRQEKRLHHATVELQVRTNDGQTIPLKFVASENFPAISTDHPESGIKEMRLERLPAERVDLQDVPEHVRGRLGLVE